MREIVPKTEELRKNVNCRKIQGFENIGDGQ